MHYLGQRYNFHHIVHGVGNSFFRRTGHNPKEKLQKTRISLLQLPYFFNTNENGLLCLYSVVFVRNSQFLSAFSTTCCQYSATVCCSHSLTETVFVLSLSVRGLKCSFHYCILFYVIILTNSGCKNRYFFQINQEITHFLSKVFVFFTDFHYFCTRKPALKK